MTKFNPADHKVEEKELTLEDLKTEMPRASVYEVDTAIYSHVCPRAHLSINAQRRLMMVNRVGLKVTRIYRWGNHIVFDTNGESFDNVGNILAIPSDTTCPLTRIIIEYLTKRFEDVGKTSLSEREVDLSWATRILEGGTLFSHRTDCYVMIDTVHFYNVWNGQVIPITPQGCHVPLSLSGNSGKVRLGPEGINFEYLPEGRHTPAVLTVHPLSPTYVELLMMYYH